MHKEIIGRNWVKDVSVEALRIGIGIQSRRIPFQPATDALLGRFSRHEPGFQVVIPTGTRKAFPKPLNRHPVIGKRRRGAGWALGFLALFDIPLCAHGAVDDLLRMNAPA